MEYNKRVNLRVKSLEIVLANLYDASYQTTEDILKLSEIIYDYLAENKSTISD